MAAIISVMIRSLVVVALVFLNSCEGRSTCLAYDDIVTSSIQDLDLDAYQGVWFVASTNEPTEPAACRCDIFNWTLTATGFSDATTTTCGPVTSTLPLIGTLSNDTRLGLLQEGLPPVFPLIDNSILYVESDTSGYAGTIRYSCKEDYTIGLPPFFYKLFESVQIWTREEVDQAALDRLYGIAMDMGIIQDPGSMRNLTYAGC
mmetsp:Transcript_32325/g.73698  ORF Transcript_32325/g.73698 Transcript_32325/m.73698 type:complete len:203 (+) Transcript_32325:34-642(+)